MGWLSIDEDEIADAVRRIFGTAGGTDGNGDGSSGGLPQPRAGFPPYTSGGGWYDPLPSEGHYAVGKTPDLNKGEGIQPFGLTTRGYIPAEGDREQLARMLYAESHGYDADYPALAWTIINRVGDRQFGPDLQSVITQQYAPGKYQLAYNSPHWTASGDPGSLNSADARSYANAMRVADDVLSGRIGDPTGGATFFYAGEKPPPTFFRPGIASGRLAPVEVPGVTMHYLRDTRR